MTFEPLVESTEPQSLTSHLHALSYVNYATSHSWNEIFVKFPSYIIRSTQKLLFCRTSAQHATKLISSNTCISNKIISNCSNYLILGCLLLLNLATNTLYSVSPIYRGRVYRGIGYIAVACWTPFFGGQERDIFREIVVTPWTQFAGDNFSRNLLTAIAFVPGSQETIFREINSSLPVNAGWNTCCAMVRVARRIIDTSIVS